jgi:uncharacterized SAM-binding protein YcdF (DUF218 family)
MTYVQPLLSILIVVFAFEAYRYWRGPDGHKPVLLSLAVIGLFLLSWLPLARLLLRPYEDLFPPRAFPAGDAQAIVVISGEMESPDPATHAHRAGRDTYARCLYAARLYKDWHALPILASGGPPRGKPHGVPDAAVMQQVLENAGVPQSMIWLEQRSLSTHENAAYSAQILRAKGVHQVVLVTSAIQMLRAELCFRKAGIAVTPAACDYASYGSYKIRDLLPNWSAIEINEDLLHETAGLLWYWIHGWI